MVDQGASAKNRIIKILKDANLKLSSVPTNVDGATGTKIINDLIAGKTDADELLLYYHRKIKATKEAFRKAFGRSAHRSPSIYAPAHSTKY